jgi:hypothetical protein
MKDDVIGWGCGAHGKISYNVMVGKYEGMRPRVRIEDC